MRTTMQDWEDYYHLILLTGWARDGLTYAQIASNIGISCNTLNSWRNKSEKICDALKVNKEMADCQVENALFKSALGFMFKEQTVTNKGEVVWVEKFERPNITAQIFYLKNRRPELWRDRRELKHNLAKDSEYVAEWGKN